MLRVVTVRSAAVQVLTHVHNIAKVFQGEYWTRRLFVTCVISITLPCVSYYAALSDFQ